MYNIHYIFLVILSQILQYFQFYTCLIIIFLLILNNLNCNLSLFLVINTPNSCTEGSFSQEVNNLIPVSNVVSNDNIVITFFIIESIIVKIFFLFFTIFLIAATALLICRIFTNNILVICLTWFPVNLQVFVVSKVINLIIVKDLSLLIVSKLVYIVSQDILRCCGKWWKLISWSNWA